MIDLDYETRSGHEVKQVMICGGPTFRDGDFKRDLHSALIVGDVGVIHQRGGSGMLAQPWKCFHLVDPQSGEFLSVHSMTNSVHLVRQIILLNDLADEWRKEGQPFSFKYDVPKEDLERAKMSYLIRTDESERRIEEMKASGILEDFEELSKNNFGEPVLED